MFKDDKIKNQIIIFLLVISIIPSLSGIFLSWVDNSIVIPDKPKNHLSNEKVLVGPLVRLIPFESYYNNSNLSGFTYDFSLNGVPDLPTKPLNPYPSVSSRRAAIQSDIATSNGVYQDNIYRAI